jgi:TonB family protein
MKNRTCQTARSCVFLSCLALLAPATTYGIENFESLKVVDSVLPIYPVSMTIEGIYDGTAQVVVQVNENGELIDTYLASYTHPLFGKLAQEAIRKWTFQPAKLNGEPLTVIKPFDFRFEDRRGVFAIGIQEAAAARLNLSGGSPDAKRVYSPRELDEIPVPIHMKTPLYPEEFKGKNIDGSVTVIFYIDDDGSVRMPHVTEYTHESFGYTALLAVKEWKFEPPLVRGKPVAILARQKFTFSEGK